MHSHKVIHNLLDKIQQTAKKARRGFEGIKKSSGGEPRIRIRRAIGSAAKATLMPISLECNAIGRDSLALCP